MQLTAMQQDMNCYGQPFSPYPAWAVFDAANSSICDAESFGSTILVTAGQTSIYGDWNADSWSSDLGGYCEYTPMKILRDALCTVAHPEIALQTARLYEVTAQFVGPGVSSRIANLNAGSSSHGNEICGDDPQLFTVRVNFVLPVGGSLVPSRCSAKPLGIPDNDYNVGAAPCEMDTSLEGHMTISIRRRCCGGDNQPGIRIVIGANKAGQSGTIDTPGTVRVLCAQ